MLSDAYPPFHACDGTRSISITGPFSQGVAQKGWQMQGAYALQQDSFLKRTSLELEAEGTDAVSSCQATSGPCKFSG